MIYDDITNNVVTTERSVFMFRYPRLTKKYMDNKYPVVLYGRIHSIHFLLFIKFLAWNLVLHSSAERKIEGDFILLDTT